jgi:predicted adenylyl cyclase CyaB
MVEIEVKIKVGDHALLKEELLNLGARLEKERFRETNILYDYPSQLLYKKKQALRLRKIGSKTFLTFKGTPQKSRKFKIREEYETEVKNERQTKKILKALGLVPIFSYQKQRTVFRKGHLKICLDELAIGNFMELEGKRNEITKWTKALGFSRTDFIRQDYIQLLSQK